MVDGERIAVGTPSSTSEAKSLMKQLILSSNHGKTITFPTFHWILSSLSVFLGHEFGGYTLHFFWTIFSLDIVHTTHLQSYWAWLSILPVCDRAFSYHIVKQGKFAMVNYFGFTTIYHQKLEAQHIFEMVSPSQADDTAEKLGLEDEARIFSGDSWTWEAGNLENCEDLIDVAMEQTGGRSWP